MRWLFLEQAGEINITPVKVEFETEQLKRKGTLQNTEYIELNPKARDFVSTKPKVNHNLNFPLLDLQSDRTMKEPTHAALNSSFSHNHCHS
jgi:hypothetical protein